MAPPQQLPALTVAGHRHCCGRHRPCFRRRHSPPTPLPPPAVRRSFVPDQLPVRPLLSCCLRLSPLDEIASCPLVLHIVSFTSCLLQLVVVLPPIASPAVASPPPLIVCILFDCCIVVVIIVFVILVWCLPLSSAGASAVHLLIAPAGHRTPSLWAASTSRRAEERKVMA